jgi:N-acyl-D-aspartate/D-glutamate deacylase
VHRGSLKWLNSCHQRGLRVYGQGLTTDAGYGFTLEDWNLWDERPAWREATLGTVEEKLAKLADPARRAALKSQMPMLVTIGIPQLVITGPASPETEQYRDMMVGAVAEKLGKHPVDAMLDIAVHDRLKTEFFAAGTNTWPGYMKEIVDNPYVLFGVSDGGAHTKFLTAGRYPTETIIKAVRENAMMSLEEAHWRLSALPAMVAGFEDRGVLRRGAPADIIVYDYANLEVLPAEIVHDLPGGEWRRIQRARGYRYIVVNGEITIEDDRETHVHAGRLLRFGRGRMAAAAA